MDEASGRAGLGSSRASGRDLFAVFKAMVGVPTRLLALPPNPILGAPVVGSPEARRAAAVVVGAKGGLEEVGTLLEVFKGMVGAPIKFFSLPNETLGGVIAMGVVGLFSEGTVGGATEGGAVGRATEGGAVKGLGVSVGAGAAIAADGALVTTLGEPKGSVAEGIAGGMSEALSVIRTVSLLRGTIDVSLDMDFVSLSLMGLTFID